MSLKIYVDADASPVQKEVIEIASETNLPVVLVKSFSHFSHAEDDPHVETIYVDKGADVADFEILKRVRKNDIVITQDYGLASLCMAKDCIVLHHKGFQYTNDNIDRLLSSRHENAMARRGGFRTKGPKPYSDEDRTEFIKLLRFIIGQSSQSKQ